MLTIIDFKRRKWKTINLELEAWCNKHWFGDVGNNGFRVERLQSTLVRYWRRRIGACRRLITPRTLCLTNLMLFSESALHRSCKFRVADSEFGPHLITKRFIVLVELMYVQMHCPVRPSPILLSEIYKVCFLFTNVTSIDVCIGILYDGVGYWRLLRFNILGI